MQIAATTSDSFSVTLDSLSTQFSQLQKQLSGKLEWRAKEYTLALNNETLTGLISGLVVEEAITYVEYDVMFKNDVELVCQPQGQNLIFFTYCSKGHIQQHFGRCTHKTKLGQFQTGIFSDAAHNSFTLDFRQNEQVKLSIIMVQVDIVTDEDLRHQLKNTFMPKTQDTYAYIGSFNLKIAQHIDHLNTVSSQGMIRALLVRGMVYLILAQEIKQHAEDIIKEENNFGSLTQTEMEAVKELSELIQLNPDNPYRLNYLSKKSGLSPCKLQKGFKNLHNRTVTDFIRNVRIEAAEKMIRTTELNISEIVYTVGLTSRSYFSKIFKEKYNCSPRYYKAHQNAAAITA